MSELYRRTNPRNTRGAQSHYVDNDGDVMMVSTSSGAASSSSYQNNSYSSSNAYSNNHSNGSSYSSSSSSSTSSPANSSYYNSKKKSKYGASSASSLPSLSYLSSVVFFVVTLFTYGGLKIRYNSLNKLFLKAQSNQRAAQKIQSSTRVELSKERSESRRLEREKTAKEKEIKDQTNLIKSLIREQEESHEERRKLNDAFGKASGEKVSEITGEVYDSKRRRQREDAWHSRIILLHKRIQRESHRQLLEMFGKNQMRVEIILDYPEDARTKLKEHKFLIEMFPSDAMPHAIHLFLFQVLHKLWDGCSFAINAPHIIQAGAYSVEGKSLMSRFERSSLKYVAYQEYNTNYTHAKWTIGFAGRPGGPDIYINKMDNSFNHGPGGQKHHALEEEADPCFAKVIDGFQALQEVFSLPTEGSNFLLTEYVKIKSARVLYPDMEPHEYDYTDYLDNFENDDAYHLEEYYEYDDDAAYDDYYHEETQHVEEIVHPKEKKKNPEASESVEQQEQQPQEHGHTQHLDEMIVKK